MAAWILFNHCVTICLIAVLSMQLVHAQGDSMRGNINGNDNEGENNGNSNGNCVGNCKKNKIGNFNGNKNVGDNNGNGNGNCFGNCLNNENGNFNGNENKDGSSFNGNGNGNCVGNCFHNKLGNGNGNENTKTSGNGNFNGNCRGNCFHLTEGNLIGNNDGDAESNNAPGPKNACVGNCFPKQPVGYTAEYNPKKNIKFSPIKCSTDNFNYYVRPGTYCLEAERHGKYGGAQPWRCSRGSVFDVSICACNHWYLVDVHNTCTGPVWK